MKADRMNLAPAGALLVIVLALCGCSPVPSEPESMPFAVPGARLDVTPAGLGCSSEGLYAADVAWSLDPGVAPTVEIQVGAERKVFARADEPAGSEQTGEWVSPGMRFYLLDRESDRLLAAVEAGAGQCLPAGPIMPDARLEPVDQSEAVDPID